MFISSSRMRGDRHGRVIRHNCEFSARVFAIKMNDYFFAERAQHMPFALPGYCP